MQPISCGLSRNQGDSKEFKSRNSSAFRKAQHRNRERLAFLIHTLIVREY